MHRLIVKTVRTAALLLCCAGLLLQSFAANALSLSGAPLSSTVLSGTALLAKDPQQTVTPGHMVSNVYRYASRSTVIGCLENGTLLKVLESQVGSTGRIQTESGEGEYYSAWYIGGYEQNPDWSEETPWCVCFLSWALEECSGYLQGQTPRFANVDKFWAEFVTSDSWKTEDPQTGDVIFFDWIIDDETNAEHTGVVLAVQDGWIYTIEGNSNNSVEICRYAEDNPYIMGYGILNWR